MRLASRGATAAAATASPRPRAGRPRPRATPPPSDATAAGQTSILSTVNAITVNTARSQPVVPNWFVRPATASTAYEVDLYLYSLQGQLETPDAAPTIHARTAGATSRDDDLGSTTMTMVGTGHYKATYTVQSTDAAEAVYFDLTWSVGAVAMADAGVAQVQDAESLATIAAIKVQTDKLTFDGSSNVKSSPQTAVSLAAGQHVVVDSGTVTTLANLPAAPQGWLTAEAIDTHALDGKGNWSTYAGGAATPNDVSGALTAYGAAKPSDLPTPQSIAAAVAATAGL